MPACYSFILNFGLVADFSSSTTTTTASPDPEGFSGCNKLRVPKSITPPLCRVQTESPKRFDDRGSENN
ncbi:PDZK1-interacting protein 1 [Anopheles sinensis]|uniref:PDZK1-interacting protein 1 n=1 Tax=Anopheles sinensis TaxID=74873 RepID=A0A084WMM7_ANOSI|nr:PDZK1-interacting protein 1 [Anopheles sinensis]